MSLNKHRLVRKSCCSPHLHLRTPYNYFSRSFSFSFSFSSPKWNLSLLFSCVWINEFDVRLLLLTADWVHTGLSAAHIGWGCETSAPITYEQFSLVFGHIFDANDMVGWTALSAQRQQQNNARNERKKIGKQFSLNRILKVSKFDLFPPRFHPALHSSAAASSSSSFFSIKLIPSKRKFMEFESGEQKTETKKNETCRKTERTPRRHIQHISGGYLLLQCATRLAARKGLQLLIQWK